jgi:hypothetical protein
MEDLLHAVLLLRKVLSEGGGGDFRQMLMLRDCKNLCLGQAGKEGRHNMSAPIEPDDPDVRVHAAWLAQVSDAADGLVARQVPQFSAVAVGVWP